MSSDSISIDYEGYLIEKKLGEVLRDVFGSTGFEVKAQFPIANKQRCDFALLLDNEPKMVFEFDGPTHYQSSHTQKLDKQKYDTLEGMGVVSVRVPYFVQLKGDAILYYLLDESIKSKVTFDHGFISKKAPLPSSFNDTGLHYFCWQLNRLPLSVSTEIWKTVETMEEEPYKLKYIPKFAYVNHANKIHNNMYDYSKLPDIICMS